jgi:hypothetical protein
LLLQYVVVLEVEVFPGWTKQYPLTADLVPASHQDIQHEGGGI